MDWTLRFEGKKIKMTYVATNYQLELTGKSHRESESFCQGSPGPGAGPDQCKCGASQLKSV